MRLWGTGGNMRPKCRDYKSCFIEIWATYLTLETGSPLTKLMSVLSPEKKMIRVV